MQPAKRAEEQMVAGGVVGKARPTEQASVDRGEGRRSDQDGDDDTPDVAPHGLDGISPYVGRVDRLTPRDDAHDTDVHYEVDGTHAEYGEHDRPRHHVPGVLYFIAEIRCGVVAQVIVDRDQESGPKSREETEREGDSMLGKVEGEGWVEVRGSGDDHERYGQDHAEPQEPDHVRNRFYATVEEGNRYHCQPDGDGPGLPSTEGVEVGEVVGHADHACRHDQGHSEQRGPDKEEWHEAARGVLIGFAQVDVGAPRRGHRGAELGPHQPVRHGEHGAQYPADERLRTPHRRDHERYCDERTNADHLRHVDSGSWEQAQSTDEALVTPVSSRIASL